MELGIIFQLSNFNSISAFDGSHMDAWSLEKNEKEEKKNEKEKKNH